MNSDEWFAESVRNRVSLNSHVDCPGKRDLDWDDIPIPRVILVLGGPFLAYEVYFPWLFVALGHPSASSQGAPRRAMGRTWIAWFWITKVHVFYCRRRFHYHQFLRSWAQQSQIPGGWSKFFKNKKTKKYHVPQSLDFGIWQSLVGIISNTKVAKDSQSLGHIYITHMEWFATRFPTWPWKFYKWWFCQTFPSWRLILSKLWWLKISFSWHIAFHHVTQHLDLRIGRCGCTTSRRNASQKNSPIPPWCAGARMARMVGGGQVVQSMHVFWAAGTLVRIFTGILKGIVLLVKASSARFRKVLRFQTEGAFNWNHCFGSNRAWVPEDIAKSQDDAISHCAYLRIFSMPKMYKKSLEIWLQTREIGWILQSSIEMELE